jgi:hypothetical protein
MGTKANLFDRIFRQPPTTDLCPTENLATEVTAHLLESFAPFRSRLLSELGVEAASANWEVRTQMRLYAPGKPWNGKIPDLVLICRQSKIHVLIEVKIDAAVTTDAGVPQTRHYREYLEDAERRRGISQGILVTLTRWSPEPALQEHSHEQIRFGQIAEWLDEATDNERESLQLDLARQWASYLRQRRWAMTKLTKRHIEAIQGMLELKGQLWDLVTTATDEVATAKKWQVSGRSSSASVREGVEGVWAGTLKRSDGADGTLQIGVLFGQEGANTILCPAIYAVKIGADLNAIGVVHDQWNGHIIQLDSLAAKVVDDSTEVDVWDDARNDIVEAVKQISNAADTAQ